MNNITLHEIQEDIQHIMYVNNLQQHLGDNLEFAICKLEDLDWLVSQHCENNVNINELPKGMQILGEALVLICEFCSLKGWDLEAILLTTWEMTKEKIELENSNVTTNSGN